MYKIDNVVRYVCQTIPDGEKMYFLEILLNKNIVFQKMDKNLDSFF